MEEKGNNDVLEEKDNDDVSEENDNDDALPVSNVEINIGEENEMIAHQFSANFAANLIQFYRGNLGVNGKYYFWKLYIFEAMENVVYFFNLRQVYLCTLSFEVVAIVYIVLIGESIFRVFVFSKTLWFSLTDAINVDSRDTQITVDIFVDLFSLIFPLAMIQTYKVKLIFSEIFWILVPPSLSLFGKLRCILNQSIALGVDQIIASNFKVIYIKRVS